MGRMSHADVIKSLDLSCSTHMLHGLSMLQDKKKPVICNTAYNKRLSFALAHEYWADETLDEIHV